ncbi:ABC transporter permease [Pelagimonas varians]|uniref:Oligopeptide transport system permease protein OppC n=1 Tax=Pelagimonas varians TaxID=696760 RepID=A0A238KDD5_9RHOB|nr:ABC transporter permease [Pelagimonas varians]PYG29897.1 peptide/nickel transport system permease protein [Pelagimonas varians]SMX40829.1 Oligopeptide transport system permease protein OppC [Pelagimonas varians]
MTETIAPIEALKDKGPDKPPRSRWKDVWDQFTKHKGAMFGLGFLIFITLAVLIGPLLWSVEPQKIDIRNKNMRPIYTAIWDADAKVGWEKPLGSDQLGRDQLAQILSGGRASMAVGWAAMVLSLLIGTAIGVAAGYYKKLDGLLMRTTDLFLALPVLPLLLLAVTLFRQPLTTAFGPEGGMFILIVSIISVTSWMPTARIVRGDVLAIKEREFVLAARSIGTLPGKIIGRHLLPNVLSPILVSAALGLATAIITESALSFLGVGFPSDFPTWGKMLADAVVRMEEYPERVLLPGIAISLTVLSVNYLGDGLRDALDPRIRGR